MAGLGVTRARRVIAAGPGVGICPWGLWFVIEMPIGLTRAERRRSGCAGSRLGGCCVVFVCGGDLVQTPNAFTRTFRPLLGHYRQFLVPVLSRMPGVLFLHTNRFLMKLTACGHRADVP